jgi:hypothetical protein
MNSNTIYSCVYIYTYCWSWLLYLLLSYQHGMENIKKKNLCVENEVTDMTNVHFNNLLM